MKKFLVVLTLLLVIAGGAPLFSGYKAEATLDQWVSYMDGAPGYDVSWDFYRKGWLSTDAVMLVRFNNPMDLPMGQGTSNGWVLPLHIHMVHGPLLVRDSFRLGWLSGRMILSSEHEGLIKKYVKVEGEGPVFVSNLYMDLTGKLHINDYSLPFSIDQSGETVRVDGYSGGGEMTLNKQFRYDGRLPSITFQGESGTMLLEGVNVSAKMNLNKLIAGTIAEGTTGLKFESLKTDLNDGENFEVDGLSIASSIDFDAEAPTADMNIEVSMKEFISLSERISELDLSVGFDNVSFSFLERYSELVKQFGSLGADGASMLAMQMSQLAATELLPYGPGISIDKLRFNSLEGSLNFNGKIEISPEAATKVNNPLSAINDVVVNASGKIDKVLAAKYAKKSALRDLNNQMLQTGQEMNEEEKIATAEKQANVQLSMLILQGMLVEDGDKYSLDFKFEDGKADLNGKPMPLPF